MVTFLRLTAVESSLGSSSAPVGGSRSKRWSKPPEVSRIADRRARSCKVCWLRETNCLSCATVDFDVAMALCADLSPSPPARAGSGSAGWSSSVLSPTQLFGAATASSKHELLRAITPALWELRIGGRYPSVWDPVLVINAPSVSHQQAAHAGYPHFHSDVFVSWKPFCRLVGGNGHCGPLVGYPADSSLIADGCVPEVYYATLASAKDMEAEFSKLDIVHNVQAGPVKGMFFNTTDFWLFQCSRGRVERLEKSRWGSLSARDLINGFLGEPTEPALLHVLKCGLDANQLGLCDSDSFLSCTDSGRTFRATKVRDTAGDHVCASGLSSGTLGAEGDGSRKDAGTTSGGGTADRIMLRAAGSESESVEAGYSPERLASHHEPGKLEEGAPVHTVSGSAGDSLSDDHHRSHGDGLLGSAATVLAALAPTREPLAAVSGHTAVEFDASAASACADHEFALTVVVFWSRVSHRHVQKEFQVMAAAAGRGLPVVPPVPGSLFTGPLGGGFASPLVGRPMIASESDILQAFVSLRLLHVAGVLHRNSTVCNVRLVDEADSDKCTAVWTGLGGELEADPPTWDSLFTAFAGADTLMMAESCMRTLRTPHASSAGSAGAAGAGSRSDGASGDGVLLKSYAAGSGSDDSKRAREYDSDAVERDVCRLSVAYAPTRTFTSRMAAAVWAKVRELSEAGVQTVSTLPGGVWLRQRMRGWL